MYISVALAVGLWGCRAPKNIWKVVVVFGIHLDIIFGI